jgi:monoamine oxidase
LLAGVVAATIFFRNRGDEFREIREKEREVPRQIDQAEKAKRKAQSDQEAQAAIARYQQMEAEREKRRKDIEELEAWRALPAAEKRALLDARFRPIESRLKGLQERTSAGVTPELKAWLEKMDSRLQAVHMFFEAGQLDQAKGLIEGLQKDLDAMLGPTAQPPQDDGKGAAGASPGAGSGTN